MLKLDNTHAFIEDRIAYFYNINEFIRLEKEKGVEVQIEGDFQQKLIDWEIGMKYIHELASPLVADKFDKITYMKTTILDDIKTMANVCKFNLDEHNKLSSDKIDQSYIRQTENQIKFLFDCMKEINDLR